MNATVSYIDKAAALRETAEQQLFYVIGNSVGISYYIKRHCVPESAVRGEEYCIMALLMRFLLMKMYDFDTMNKRRKMNL